MSSSYDVVIIGGGPAALSMLSALRTPRGVLSDAQKDRRYKNGETNKLAVCVIDRNGEWLTEWRGKFRAADIGHLRSPAWAHPDASHKAALMEFAWRTGRENELMDEDMPRPAGNDLGAGLFYLPGSDLFGDFCRHLSQSLTHDLVKGHVVDIEKNEKYDVFVQTPLEETVIRAQHVVFAVGSAGPLVPPAISSSKRVVHSSEWRTVEKLRFSRRDTVIVLGGGLSAAQAALLAARHGAGRVILVSRRPLESRHYDLPFEFMNPWTLGPGASRARLAEFYDVRINERAKWIRRERGGATVPPTYLRQLRRHPNIDLRVDQVVDIESQEDNALRVVFEEGPAITATTIVLGTGHHNDCTRLDLFRKVINRFDLPVSSGLPVLDQNLQWGDEKFTVVGALAMLQVGPDAGNLSGFRRAAQACADNLDVYNPLQDFNEPLSNIYDGFAMSDSSDDDDSDDDSEVSSSKSNDVVVVSERDFVAASETDKTYAEQPSACGGRTSPPVLSPPMTKAG